MSQLHMRRSDLKQNRNDRRVAEEGEEGKISRDFEEELRSLEGPADSLGFVDELADMSKKEEVRHVVFHALDVIEPVVELALD